MGKWQGGYEGNKGGRKGTSELKKDGAGNQIRKQVNR